MPLPESVPVNPHAVRKLCRDCKWQRGDLRFAECALPAALHPVHGGVYQRCMDVRADERLCGFIARFFEAKDG